MPVCLLLAGVMVATLPTEVFTLAWMHSVEKTEWREDWRGEDGRLTLVEAAVAGSGAGMQPAEGARLDGGFWRWRPDTPQLARLLLANSAYGGDYRLCWEDTCRPLPTLLPEAGGAPLEIAPCPPRTVRGVADDGQERTP